MCLLANQIHYAGVGLKYLHLSEYETRIQSLIEACERQMAKETWGIKCKVHRKSKH